MFRFPCLFIIVGVPKVRKFCINQLIFPWLPGKIKKKKRIKQRKYLIRQIIHNTIPILPLAGRDDGALSFKVSFFAKRSHKSTMCKWWEWSYNCISRGVALVCLPLQVYIDGSNAFNIAVDDKLHCELISTVIY